MKKIIVIFLALLFYLNSSSQTLIIKGRIRCINQNENSTKGAENIVIVPAFIPARSTITLPTPSGYFEFNTELPISKLQDKVISIHAISRCANCKETTKRVFISEDQDRNFRTNEKQYVTIKDWMLKTKCEKAELKPLAADSLLNVVTAQPGQNLNNMTAASALAGTPAFLNFLTTLTTVVGAAGFPTGRFNSDLLLPGDMNYGQFLLASPFMQSANTGFNFSPSRDMSEAVFWNPSAIAFSRKEGNISLLSNFRNTGKLTAFARLSNRFSLGGGAIFTIQDEFRKARFSQNQNIRYEDSMSMNLMEYAAFLSPSFKVNKSLSIGMSVKFANQEFNTPNFAIVENDGNWAFTDSNTKKQFVNFDLSATYKIKNILQIGINVMNLKNDYLFADAFTPIQVQIPIQNQRSLGLGVLYKWKRFNAGVDILANADGIYDASLGLNYVPFNNALIAAGVAMKEMSYSLSFRLKHFRLAYINDNNWIVNEKRVGRLDFLNGRIYSGFIFDL